VLVLGFRQRGTKLQKRLQSLIDSDQLTIQPMLGASRIDYNATLWQNK